jgi:hypothetical protein
MRVALIQMAFFAAFLTVPGIALAEDAGEGGTNGDSSVSEAVEDASGVEESLDASSEAAPVAACDGSFCDTRSGSNCSIASVAPVGTAGNRAVLGALGTVLALGIARKTKRGASCPS